MQSFASRAGRWPLALTLTALVALAACSDEPVAPKTNAPTPLAAKTPTLGPTLYVTNTSGGLEPGSFRWAAKQIETGGGGTIVFDSTLGGKTITLDDGIGIVGAGEAFILGPPKGVTISGKNQFRLMHVNRLTMENVTLTKGNSDWGSAIDAYYLVLKNSTVHGNSGPNAAIYASESLDLINSTVSGNTTGGPAVQYGRLAQVLIDNSTIAFNAPGGGIGPWSTPFAELRVTLRNSIISNNAQNCSNYYNLGYEGKNIVDDWSCADVAITPSDPLLLPLANNGGPSLTHAIPFNSPAFNKGVNCSVNVDQRYVPRDGKCDVGAFEFNDFTNVTITIDPTVKTDAATGPVLTGTIKCSRNESLHLAVELHQDQKVGKQVVDIQSADTFPLECTTSGGRWSTHMPLLPGEAFQAGAARATAQTVEMPEWVKPASAASAVKIAITRK